MRKRRKGKRILTAAFMIFIITGVMNTALACDCEGSAPSSCHICPWGFWIDTCNGCLTCFGNFNLSVFVKTIDGKTPTTGVGANRGRF